MTLYPYRELTTTSKVQECCGRESAAKLGEFDYIVHRGITTVHRGITKVHSGAARYRRHGVVNPIHAAFIKWLGDKGHEGVFHKCF